MEQRSVLLGRVSAGPEPVRAGGYSPLDRRLRRVLQVMESQPAQSVHELAREVSLSPAHLERLFKRETGTHLRDALAEKRLQRAQHLLVHSNMEIKEIACAVGYRHHSSFVRAFRRRAGESPKRYRQREQYEFCSR